MNVEVVGVISVRPHHAARVWSGAKRVEFRRVRVRLNTPAWLAVYETFPIGAVTGTVRVDSVERSTPERLLALEQDRSERRLVLEYLRGAEQASALHLGSAHPLPESLPLQAFGISRAPQSYQFLREVVVLEMATAVTGGQ